MSVDTRNDILASIDLMNEVVQESEFSVISSLLDQFDKASTILESYDGSEDGLDMFAIYQEAEEGSTVQQGEPSGQVNAELGKKKNIIVKIWEFIKNIFKSIGGWIKKCWNGTVVPTVEAVGDAAGDLIDKITDKDESWIRENAANLGIGAGAILSACIGYAIVNKELKSGAENFKKGMLGLGLVGASDIASTVMVFKITKNGINSSIAIPALCQLITIVIGTITMTNNADKIVEILMKKDDIKTGVKNVLQETPKDYDFSTIETNLNDVKEKMNSLSVDSFTIEESKTPDDSDADKTQKAGVFANILGKIIKFAQDFINKILDALKKVKEYFATIRGEYGKSNTEETGSETGDKPATEDSLTDVENDVNSGEADATAAPPEIGTSFTPEELETQYPKNSQGGDMITKSQDGSMKTFIPYGGEDEENHRPHGFKWHPDDNKYVYETADEEINEEDEVVEESYGYYYKK